MCVYINIYRVLRNTLPFYVIRVVSGNKYNPKVLFLQIQALIRSVLSQSKGVTAFTASVLQLVQQQFCGFCQPTHNKWCRLIYEELS